MTPPRGSGTFPRAFRPDCSTARRYSGRSSTSGCLRCSLRAAAWSRVWRTQPRDPVENATEQLARHRHLRHLEDQVAAVGHDLRPIFTTFSRRLVRDQSAITFGSASVRRKLARLYASAWSWRRTAFARKVVHESRVHLTACFPSLIHCSAVPRPL